MTTTLSQSAPLLPRLLILYVDQPQASAAFYARLFGREPVESSPTFCMFALDGLMVGLWSRHTVEPAAAAAGGGAEVAFPVADAPAVEATFAAWSGLGLPIVQPVTLMDFGTPFVALDPDGHRLRVFAPAAE